MAIEEYKQDVRWNIRQWFGLSSDAKPSVGAIGSTVYEIDTGDLYVYTSAGWVLKYDLVKLDALPSLPSLVGGEAHIGETGRWSDLIVVTPTIAAAAFSAKDFVGGKLTLVNALRVAAGKGQINSLNLVDKSRQNANLLIFVFGTDLAGAYADNAVESITTADWLNWIGTIEILSSDYKQMANASVVDFAGMGLDIKAVSGSNLYALIVTTGTPSYGADALQLTFGVGDK